MAVAQRKGQHKIGVRMFGSPRHLIFYVAAVIGPLLGLKNNHVKYGDPLCPLGKSPALLAAGSAAFVLVAHSGAGDVRHPHASAFNGENAT
jgi:hypothetical protein